MSKFNTANMLNTCAVWPLARLPGFSRSLLWQSSSAVPTLTQALAANFCGASLQAFKYAVAFFDVAVHAAFVKVT
jgi:hypothetical protein